MPDHNLDQLGAFRAPLTDRVTLAGTSNERTWIMVTRGFFGRRLPPEIAERIPPGQYLEKDFPVLSAGPTQYIPLEQWRFTLKVGPRPIKKWTWEEFNALPQISMTRDIHCVTKWTKLDTPWEGVLIDDIMADAGLEPPTNYTLATSFGGYSTNVPFEDLTDGKSMIALRYEGEEIEPEHGGPARLLVPHLYFWKSAKWINALQFTDRDEPGFWELRGYHIYGDPWEEQRYTGD
jgi:DMSO/TMAO reductase YedYZ molybdopterin-dependent catalytic subunit